MRRLDLILVLAFALGFCHGSTKPSETLQKSKTDVRNGKVFSIFSIVTFKNTECTSNSGTTYTSGINRNGTCFTSTECSDKGGSSAGNCASGFGVCCLFIVSTASSTISQNNTYIQNPSFPSVYSSTSSLTYTVNKCSADICMIRLDFETFTLLGPSLTTEASGGACQDSFVVTGSSSLSSPTICGVNDGQHVYMDLGTSSSGTGTIAFTFSSTTSTVRTWEIKVSQISCSSPAKPLDAGCLQYHVGKVGKFKTFNFGASSGSYIHLASQRYSICIRREENYCCIQYQTCSDSYSYTLAIGPNSAMADQDSNCSEDYVGIAGVSAECDKGPGAILHSRLCGPIFNTENDAANALGAICDCTIPFVVDIYTDATADAVAPAAILPSRGLCLTYMQIPCDAA